MSENITHRESTKRLERSSSDRMLAGVSGGLGRYFDLNPTFFRLGFVVLTLLGGAGILDLSRRSARHPGRRQGTVDRGRDSCRATRAAVAACWTRPRRRCADSPSLACGDLARCRLRLGARPARRARDPVASDATRGNRRSRILVRSLVGLTVALIVAVSQPWRRLLVVRRQPRRRRRRLTSRHRRASAELKSSYQLGVGDLRVDLSNIGPLTTETHVQAKVGVGELRIVVPSTAAVTANARAKLGEVYVLSRHADGRNAEVSTGSGGLLVIDARVGAGRVDVVRAYDERDAAPLFERSSDDRVIAGRVRRFRRTPRRRRDPRPADLRDPRARRRRRHPPLPRALDLRAESAHLAAAALFAAAGAILFALGLSATALLGATLLVAGLATVLVRGGSLRPGGSLPILGVALADRRRGDLPRPARASGAFLAPGAVAGALLLVVGPWLWQLTRSAPSGYGCRSGPRSPRGSTTPSCRRSR